MLFKHQYSLRDQNRWLHWLALQNLLSERSHFQVYDIQPDRLNGRFQKLWYRLLFGTIAGILLGGWFGFSYSFAILLIISSLTVNTGDGINSIQRWNSLWNSSAIVQMPTIILNSTVAGIFIGCLTLGFHLMNGHFREIHWMQPLRLKIDSLGKSICISSLVTLFLSLFMQGKIHLNLTGFLVSFSASLAFSTALMPKERRNSPSDASPTTAIANSSYLLWFIFPSLFMIIILVFYEWNSLIFMHIFHESHLSNIIPVKSFTKFIEIYPGLFQGIKFAHQFSSLWLALSLGFYSGLIGVMRSRPVFAAISLIQYGVMRFLIGLYGLGPFNYGSFLRSAINQDILKHDIQGYQFVDPDDLAFYALMKFD